MSRLVGGRAWGSVWGWGLAAALLLAGCGPSRFVPSKAEGVFTGAPVFVERPADDSGVWTVVVENPSGGWVVSLDHLQEQVGRQEVFVSLRPPNPAFIVTPAVVRQRVLTPVRADSEMWVYVRRQNFRGEPEDGAFTLATTSRDARPAPVEPAK